MMYKGKGRDIAWSVCYVDHIFKFHTPQLLGNLGIDIDAVNLSDSFIDFKNRTRFRRIIDRINDFVDERLIICIRRFHQFAAPDIIHIIHQLHSPDYLCKPGADNIMLYLNIIFRITRIISEHVFCFPEKFQRPRIKLLQLSKRTKLCII